MHEKFSLWIVPPPNFAKPLEEIIFRLSKEHNSSSFSAHMTLIGDISGDEKTIFERTKELASSTDQFPLILGEISFSTTFFQSVFVRVESSGALMDLNLKAKEIFGVDNNVFMPHISLLYGDHPMSTREQIASELELPSDLSFNAEKLTIIPTPTMIPKDWKSIAEIPLRRIK